MIKNISLNWIKYLNSLIFPLITFAYASRILGASSLGKIDYSRSIVTYFALFASLGISNYGVREAAKVRDDKTRLSKVVKEILCINILSSTVAYCALFLVVFHVSKLYEYKDLILISSISIMFTACGLDWLYSAMEDYLYITVRSFVFQIISLIFMFLLVKDADDYIAYACIIVFSSTGSNVLNLIHSRKYITYRGFEGIQIRKHIRPILVFFSITLAVNVYVSLDTTMLGWMTNDTQVGFYSAAVKMSRIVCSLITSVCGVLLPRLSYYAENKDRQNYDKLLMNAWRFMCFLMIPGAIFLFFMSREILLLFCGGGYIDAIPTSMILSVIVLFIPVSTFISHQIYIPLGCEKYQLAGTVIGAVSNVIFNAFLIPLFAANGAAAGSALAEFTVVIIAFIFGNRCFPMVKLLKSLIKYVAAGSATAAVFVLLNCTELPILPSLLMKSVVAGLVYIAALLILREEGLNTMVGMVKNKIKNSF